MLGSMQTLRMLLWFVFLSGVFPWMPEAGGAGEVREFATKPSELRASVSVPVSDRLIWTEMPQGKIRARVRRAPQDPRVEPVLLHVDPSDAKDLRRLASKLAEPSRQETLIQRLQQYAGDPRHLGPTSEGRRGANGILRRPIVVDQDLLGMIDTSMLAGLYARSHHEVTLHPHPSMARPGDEWAKGPLGQLWGQLEGFLSQDSLDGLLQTLRSGKTLSLDRDLLPDFARKMVRRYLVYRGPNCFHAALAFHGADLTKSALINVREEDGYHRSMINFDELWRALQTNFYEVRPEASELKYGDILAFFEIPAPGEPVTFRLIRHAAVYLFGGYTFSKGSKSPNTTYTVNTLDEEWNAWSRRVGRLGVKVFRPTHRTFLSRIPPRTLGEWFY